jgi:hypothetical protein
MSLQRQGILTMNRFIRTSAALLALWLIPSAAAAELRRVQLSVLGMD